jgi:lysophospholipase L1-like esterase
VGNFWRTDPETGWSLQPGATGRWFNPPYEYDVDVAINSQGLRDVERAGYDKPDGVFRVLLLGDSYVEGLRVPLAQTFGKTLEAALNEAAPAGQRYEVINAGVSGWGTDQQLLWLRSEGLKYQTDLVLLSFFPGNDFQNISEALEVANMGRVQKPFFQRTEDGLVLRYHPFDPDDAPQPEPPAAPVEPPKGAVERLAGLRAWLAGHSALYRFTATVLDEASPGLALALARRGLVDAPQAVANAAAGPDYVPVAYGIYRQPLESDWSEAIALAGDLVTTLREEVGASGGRLAMVSLPAPEQVYPERWQRIVQRYTPMQAGRWDLEQPGRAAQQVAQQAGIPFLDLLPIFREAAAASSEPLHLRVDGHWTPAGERLAGEATADFLLGSGLLNSQN